MTFKQVLQILLESTKAKVLKVAMKRNGELHIGTLYQNHFDISDQIPVQKLKPTDEYQYGFVTPEGKFLSRKNSLLWVKENTPDIYKEYLKIQKKLKPQEPGFGYVDELESVGYLKALGIHESKLTNN